MQSLSNQSTQLPPLEDSALRRPVGPGVVRGERNAESLRVLGTLAAGMAHDLRNVLNGIFLRVQLLERSNLHATPDVAESVAELRKDVLVGTELVNRIRNYARGDAAAHSGSVDLNDVLAEACELAKLGGDAASSARPTVKREPGAVHPVAGERGELVSAVLNLLLNAVEAMPDGGHITVRTGSTQEETWIEVEDDGPGIPEHVQARMFDPFFTTKGSTGTGLGLASVADCLQRHGGSIRVRTAPGQGTRIALSFPSTSR